MLQRTEIIFEYDLNLKSKESTKSLIWALKNFKHGLCFVLCFLLQKYSLPTDTLFFIFGSFIFARKSRKNNTKKSILKIKNKLSRRREISLF